MIDYRATAANADLDRTTEASKDWVEVSNKDAYHQGDLEFLEPYSHIIIKDAE